MALVFKNEIEELAQKIEEYIYQYMPTDKEFDVESEHYVATVKWWAYLKYDPGDYWHEPWVTLVDYEIDLRSVYNENGPDMDAYNELDKLVRKMKFNY